MKSLKITLLLAIALVSFNTACAQWGNEKIRGNGDVTTITRTTSSYDNVKLAGWMDFELVKGKEGKITLEGESNLLDYIITESEGNSLIIKIKNNINLKPTSNKGIKITIPFTDINKVTLSGSGDVTCNTTIKSSNFETRLSGSGDITLDINANDTEVVVTGSGDINLSGKTEKLEVSVTGSGDFDGGNLSANYTEAKVTGSGDIVVVANKEIEARVTGSGDIEYKGNPEKVSKKVTGSGDISN
ncbi:hypothetical protein FHS04_002479 [Mesoflavibacter sabulilitoris]|uniref:DUF2807 domain-containing protein n=1 Tax=Mesoflavibacter zeaxanthinifaciens subsp. sabulilitoris TaxID=1520893 RepID=A0A2T1NEW6_9FLAO|nr:head GIN domain-containing protein [Mesoflavibacter zeaxanthinifaciens]MBB3124952.1 hypothetical protein [Mesoflavibacter zeaxanthinifaciens subsp. sabulilitoris]PSG90970.1 DUF2807 domain-containing protein [Mesoflavibacter zeaxanthinifaciens subsp. sabulilitoris]